MEYYDNGSFIEHLDPGTQLAKKSQANTIIIICLIVTSTSGVILFWKLRESQKQLIFYKQVVASYAVGKRGGDEGKG